jgi:hypothetical protein
MRAYEARPFDGGLQIPPCPCGRVAFTPAYWYEVGGPRVVRVRYEHFLGDGETLVCVWKLKRSGVWRRHGILD